MLQVMFTLRNDPTRCMARPGLKFAPIAVDCGAAQYDLTLTMTRTESGLDGRHVSNMPPAKVSPGGR
jgi:hypothetical protein